jgi:hypothetical protein
MNIISFKKTDAQPMTEASKTLLVETLISGVVQVTFEKHDGTTRVMVCTLKPSYLPEGDSPRGRNIDEVLQSISVYDLDKSEWRSFVFDRISFWRTK